MSSTACIVLFCDAFRVDRLFSSLLGLPRQWFDGVEPLDSAYRFAFEHIEGPIVVLHGRSPGVGGGQAEVGGPFRGLRWFL